MHAGARRLWQTCGGKPGLQGLPRAALQEALLLMRKGALWHAASFNEGPATSIGRTVAADGRLVAALRGEVLRMRFEKRGAPDHKTVWLSGPFSKGKLSNTCALQHVFPVTPPEKKSGGFSDLLVHLPPGLSTQRAQDGDIWRKLCEMPPEPHDAEGR